MEPRPGSWCFSCDAPVFGPRSTARADGDPERCPRCGSPVWHPTSEEAAPGRRPAAHVDPEPPTGIGGEPPPYGLTLGPDGAVADDHDDGPPSSRRVGALLVAVAAVMAAAVIVVAGGSTTTIVPELAEEPPIPDDILTTTTTTASTLDPYRPGPETLVYAHGPSLPGLAIVVGDGVAPPLSSPVLGVITGGRAVTIADGVVQVWDPGGTVAVDAPVPRSVTVAVAPGGRTVYGLAEDGRPWRWRWDGGLTVGDGLAPIDPEGRVEILVSPSGARAGYTDGEETVLWDGGEPTPLARAGWLVAVGDDRIALWRFDPEPHLEIVHTEEAFTPSLVLRSVALRPDPFPVGSGMFDPSGEMLAVVGILRPEEEPERAGAWLVGVGNGRLERIARGVPARSLAWAGDGSAVYAISADDVIAYPVDGSRGAGLVGTTPDGRIFVGSGIQLAVSDTALEPRGDLLVELPAGTGSVGRLELRPSGGLALGRSLTIDDGCGNVDVVPVADVLPTHDALVAHCGPWLILRGEPSTVTVPPELAGRPVVGAAWERTGEGIAPGDPRLWIEVAERPGEAGGRVGPIGTDMPGSTDRAGRSLSVLGGIPVWVADGAVWSPHGMVVAPGSFPGDGVEGVVGIGDALYVAFDNGRGRLQLFRLPEASPQVLQPFPVEPQVGPEGPLFFVAGDASATRLMAVPGDELLLWTIRPDRTLVVRLPSRRTPDPCRGRICAVDVLAGRILAVSPDGHWVLMDEDGGLSIRSLRGRDGLRLDPFAAPDTAAWVPSDG